MILPKISIVVPSYNQGEYLEATLSSIINQQYPNLELFVADGGSTDKSVEIIKKYEQHITWWVSEKDKGQSDAINKGLQRAKGDIISWLCSDDLFTPGTLQKVADYFSSCPSDVGLIHGGSKLFNASGKIADSWGYDDPSLERNLAGMAFPQPSAFFLKKYLDIIGRQVNTELHYGMDYDLFCRLACVCRFIPVKDIFSEYRLHDSSKSVKEQDRFMNDWSSAFVNLCKNVAWNDILDELKASGFLTEKVLEFYYPFSFTPDKNLLQKADKKKILFYHYCYLLKAFYWGGQMDQAGKLLTQLRKQYSSEWLKKEKDIPKITKKLALPGFVLRTLKKIKRL
jgi:glycosyltransferase involved in cell wall biosynthesis